MAMDNFIEADQLQVIVAGNNPGVQLYGTNFCLDAQTQPAPGRQVV